LKASRAGEDIGRSHRDIPSASQRPFESPYGTLRSLDESMSEKPKSMSLPSPGKDEDEEAIQYLHLRIILGSSVKLCS
jgi:hypothetical protein